MSDSHLTNGMTTHNPDTTTVSADVTLGMASLIPIVFGQQLLASLTFPVAKLGLAQIDPFVFGFFRYAISSLAFLAIVKLRKHAIAVERRDLIRMFALGVLIIFLNQTTFLYGQKLTAAGHGALLFATTPLWIVLFAVLFLKERLTVRRTTGMLIALAGVIVVMSGGAIRIGREYLIGDLVILVAVITWGIFTVLTKPLIHKYGAFRTTAYCLIFGSIVYAPFGIYLTLQTDFSQVTTAGWLSVFYVAIGTSVFAYYLWSWLLRRMPASRLAIFQNLQPIIASIIAYFMINEPLGWPFVIGGAITLGGILLSEV